MSYFTLVWRYKTIAGVIQHRGFTSIFNVSTWKHDRSALPQLLATTLCQQFLLFQNRWQRHFCPHSSNRSPKRCKVSFSSLNLRDFDCSGCRGQQLTQEIQRVSNLQPGSQWEKKEKGAPGARLRAGTFLATLTPENIICSWSFRKIIRIHFLVPY